VRATTLLNRVIDIKYTRIVDVHFEDDELRVDVEPTTRRAMCSGCGRRVDSLYDARERSWRHLDLAGTKTVLQYRIRRVDCPRCGVTVEMVPWAEAGSWFTHDFEQTAAYLAQHAAKSVVVEMMRVAWTTVGAIIQRVVDRLGPQDRLDGLADIGVDELSYRKHHEYVTVVIDHRRQRIVWAAKGKSSETLRGFFQALGPERSAKLETVSIDMSAAYIRAVTDAAPHARIVFDKFHVQRLAHDALDEVRRAETRGADDQAQRAALKHSRFALQKNTWNLTDIEHQKLSEVQRTNRRLYRGYLLKESLAEILRGTDAAVASAKLTEWAAWAGRSRLAPFARVGSTIRSHLDGIVAYVATGLTNARTEGLNGKARTITRRSYGLHSASSLIAMLFLCCSGLLLTPAHAPRCTH
jgi:transposase